MSCNLRDLRRDVIKSDGSDFFPCEDPEQPQDQASPQVCTSEQQMHTPARPLAILIPNAYDRRRDIASIDKTYSVIASIRLAPVTVKDWL